MPSNCDARFEPATSTRRRSRRSGRLFRAPTTKRSRNGCSASQRSDQAHCAHCAARIRRARSSRSSGIDKLIAALAGQPAEVLELLERIDDLVFAAISGDELALTELRSAVADGDRPNWTPTWSSNRASSICDAHCRSAASASTAGVQRPERAVAAIDVLCVLFEE